MALRASRSFLLAPCLAAADVCFDIQWFSRDFRISHLFSQRSVLPCLFVLYVCWTLSLEAQPGAYSFHSSVIFINTQVHVLILFLLKLP